MGSSGTQGNQRPQRTQTRIFAMTSGEAQAIPDTVIGIMIVFGICHNGFLLDWDDHKIKWSPHRSFLYECDRSPGVHVLKLGIEIPNLK